MRFLRAMKTLAGLLAVLFVGIVATLFIGLPRVANMLADLLGTGAESAVHWLPLIPIYLILLLIAYFWVWRPWQQFTFAQKARGLIVERGQGRAFMDPESVRQQVYAAVVKVPNVQRVEISIDNDLGRAHITMNVLADQDINAPKKKQDISREVKKIVQDQLGVLLAGEPTINLSLTPIGIEVPQVTIQEAAPAAPVAPARPATVRASAPAPAPAAEPVQPVHRAAPEPTPAPRTRREPPVPTRTVPEPVSAPPIILGPPAKTETTVTEVTETEVVEPATPTPDHATESPVSGARPFTRRPFTPPAGSTTLPDLPKIDDRPKPHTDASDITSVPPAATNSDSSEDTIVPGTIIVGHNADAAEAASDRPDDRKSDQLSNL